MSIPLDVLVGKYIEARDRKDQLKKAFDEKVAALDAAMAQVEGAILAYFNASGQTNAKTPNGTAFVNLRTSCTVQDWDPFLEFVRENDAWHMLERRAAKKSVEEYRTERNELPPGLKWSEERVIQIRRS